MIGVSHRVGLLCLALASAAMSAEQHSVNEGACAATPTTIPVRVEQWSPGFDAAELFSSPDAGTHVPVLLRGAPVKKLRDAWTANHVAEQLEEWTNPNDKGFVIRVQSDPTFKYYKDNAGLGPFADKIAEQNARDPTGVLAQATPQNLRRSYEKVKWPALDVLLRIMENRTQGEADKWRYYSEGTLLDRGALLQDINALLPDELFLRCHALPNKQGNCNDQFHLWTTSAGATTAMHFDDNYNANLMLVGRKRWLLAPPQVLPNAYQTSAVVPSHINSQIVFPVGYNTTVFPAFNRSLVHEVEQRAGDLLYLPLNWLHAVETLEPSLAVNSWPEWRRAGHIDGVFHWTEESDEETGALFDYTGQQFRSGGRPLAERTLQLIFANTISGVMARPGETKLSGVSRVALNLLDQRFLPWLPLEDLVARRAFPMDCEPIAQVFEAQDRGDATLSGMIDRIVPLFGRAQEYKRGFLLHNWIENFLLKARSLKRFREIPFWINACLVDHSSSS